MLNTLDGLATPQGLITIITTNHVAALDPAIVRPCRIDLQVKVTVLDRPAFAAMFASYCGRAPDWGADAYAPQTGARLQELFIGAPDAAAAEAAVRRACARLAGAA